MRHTTTTTGIKAVLVAVLCMPPLIHANESAGARLFQDNCVHCHGSPSGIKSEPDGIQTVLESGSLRKYRLTLSKDDIVLITEYLATVNKGNN